METIINLISFTHLLSCLSLHFFLRLSICLFYSILPFLCMYVCLLILSPSIYLYLCLFHLSPPHPPLSVSLILLSPLCLSVWFFLFLSSCPLSVYLCLFRWLPPLSLSLCLSVFSLPFSLSLIIYLSFFVSLVSISFFVCLCSTRLYAFPNYLSVCLSSPASLSLCPSVYVFLSPFSLSLFLYQ